jgi:hypothetical protein
MWRVTEVRPLESETRYFPEQQVEVQVAECRVQVSDSFPDGKAINHAFPKSLFNFNYNTRSGGGYSDNSEVDSSQWGKQRRFGRGQA